MNNLPRTKSNRINDKTSIYLTHRNRPVLELLELGASTPIIVFNSFFNIVFILSFLEDSGVLSGADSHPLSEGV